MTKATERRPRTTSAAVMALLAAMLGLAFTSPVRAALSAEELAKLAQNPIGNFISVPFQNNTNFNAGPLKGTQSILNIQPVYEGIVSALDGRAIPSFSVVLIGPIAEDDARQGEGGLNVTMRMYWRTDRECTVAHRASTPARPCAT